MFEYRGTYYCRIYKNFNNSLSIHNYCLLLSEIYNFYNNICISDIQNGYLIIGEFIVLEDEEQIYKNREDVLKNFNKLCKELCWYINTRYEPIQSKISWYLKK
jgi:hypothetical protein